MNAQALAERTDEQSAVAPIAPTNNPVMDMIRQAVAAGQPLEVIRELKTMAKELAEDAARRAFDAAMSDARAEIPVILKNRNVNYDHKDGNGKTSYRHEDLGEIARTVDPILSRHGLSYRFRTTSEPNSPVVVTCIVAHRGGHNEENTLSAGRDESGKKNSIQAIASTITYLQRYTLKAALGLAASDDDDGAKGDEMEGDLITEEQSIQLGELLDSVADMIPGATRERQRKGFLKYMKIESLSDIKAADYQRAVDAINSTRPAK